MQQFRKTLTTFATCVAFPTVLCSVALAGGGFSIGADLCVGTQCTGTGGCRPTPKVGGSANYHYYNIGKCQWVWLAEGSCTNRNLNCLKITYYTSSDCSGTGSSSTTTANGC